MGEIARVMQEARVGEEIPPQKDRFYLVVPNPTNSRGLALFPVLQPFDIKRRGMPWLTTHIVSGRASIPGQRLAEAVALAGLRAAADGCPRTVVLVIGEDVVDNSGYRSVGGARVLAGPPCAVRRVVDTNEMGRRGPGERPRRPPD